MKRGCGSPATRSAIERPKSRNAIVRIQRNDERGCNDRTN
jgi:hypothetical protein